MRRFAANVWLILLVAAGSVFAQDFHLYGFSMFNFDFLGAGSRARAMAGAAVGVADDAAALTWNPAGLIQITKTQASVAGSVIRMEAGSDMTYASASQLNFNALYRKDLLNLDFGSFVAPLRIKGHPFVASAIYQRIQDNVDDRYHWRYLTYSQPFPGTTFEARGDAVLASRTTLLNNSDKFALGFGTGIYENLSSGVAVNIYSGDGSSRYYASFLDTLPLTQSGQVIDTVEVRQVYQVENLLSTKGANFTGSLMYRTPKVRVGATISTPFELVFDHDIKYTDTAYVKSIRIPGAGTPSAIRPVMYRGKTKVEMPLIIGLGGSIKPNDQITLAADIELRSSGSTTYFVRVEPLPATSADSIYLLTQPGSIYYNDSTETSYYDAKGDLIEVFSEYDIAYESSMQIRIGGEYLIKTKKGTFPLRAGVRLTQQPYREVTNLSRDERANVEDGFELGDKVSNTTFTFGTGAHWSQVLLDFSVEIGKQEQVESGFRYRVNNQPLDYSDTRTRKQPTFMLTFTGLF